jgi:hypothetical protein
MSESNENTSFEEGESICVFFAILNSHSLFGSGSSQRR